jgi:two-component system NtrC family sensor kinase
VLQLPPFSGPHATGWLVLLIVLDLLVFVSLGRFLIDRLVVRPLAETAAAAEAIADGDYERRVVPGNTREMATLTSALNRLTDQLLHNQTRLAENVASLDETNRVLLATQKDLVQAEKLASIGRLASGVAHEIGNPLGALLGYVSVLRRRGADAELLGGMEREARRIDRIVRGLLDYARPGSAPKEAVDINESIRSVLALLGEQGRLRGVEVVMDLAPELPPVHAAAHQVDQVFVNLFTNAEAAMNGVGRLSVTTRIDWVQPPRPIRKRRADDPPGINYAHLRRMRQDAPREPDHLEVGTEVVRVVVADSGPGISDEHIANIFDPFFTTKPPGEGTGLGLAIVSSTMAELGGRIEVDSPSSGGAVFSLLFPPNSAAR